MNQRIKLLDCTLRDGGFALEDAMQNGEADVYFEEDVKSAVLTEITASKIDIIEIGAIELSEHDKSNLAIYQNVESISAKIPSNKVPGQMYAALFRGPDTPIDDIPNWNSSLCEGLRVIIRYSELSKSLDFCKALAQKGYKVFVQPMLTMRYTEDEITLLIKASNEMNAYALYFVDSYGYMQEQDIIRLFKRFDASLSPSIKIGFHAHNNMNLAFSNALAFINCNTSREIIVDSCLLGMGQGAGNLQTEIIVDYMNRTLGCSYSYKAVLAACDIMDQYWDSNIWGYSVAHLLPAIHQTAYKYSVAFRNRYKMSFVEINHILKNMPDNMRHRYTPENAIKLMKLFNYPINERGGK